MSRQRRGRSKASNRIPHSLVALSSAAVLTVYSAGYLRTRSAAEQFAGDGDQRRTAGPPEGSVVALPVAPPLDAASASTPLRDAVAPAKPDAAPPSGPSPKPADAPAPAPVPESTQALADVSAVASTLAPANAAPVTTDIEAKSTEAPAGAPIQPPAEARALYKDGTYSGWGTSRHGDIQATVVVEAGRIASATISQCLTRYSCVWISMLPPQVIARQSPDVDYVSGATQSTNAFYYAVLEALSKAK